MRDRVSLSLSLCPQGAACGREGGTFTTTVVVVAAAAVCLQHWNCLQR